MFRPVDPIKYLKEDPLLQKFKEKWEDLRAAGKTINFGLIYGMQEERFAGSLSKIWKKEVTVEQAAEIYQKYFEAMHGVVAWIAATKRYARRWGHIQTILGRMRRLSGIRSSKRWEVSRAERQAVNSVIQGSAADIVIVAQLKLSRDAQLKAWGFKMLLQVHDEIVFKCKKRYMLLVMSRVKYIMENPFSEPLTVKLVAEPGFGRNWAEAKAA